MLKYIIVTTKKLLAIVWVRKTYEAISLLLLNVSSFKILSLFHYGLSYISFGREHYAVLRGRRAYYRNLKMKRKSHIGLRRNIHRIEKALLMRPRRDFFALDYIEETVEFYQRAVAQYIQDTASIDDAELQWAHNVIENYFSVVSLNEKTYSLAKIFAQLPFQCEIQKKIPYVYSNIKKSSIRYEDLLSLSRQRRSIRWFLPQSIDRQLIDQALLVASQAPSACNRLPYEFKIFDDPALVKTIASIPLGTAGYAHNIPSIIVVIGKLSCYFSPRDRHVIYIDAALAVMSFILALETLGLSSSIINWPDFEPLGRKMARTLGLDSDDRVILLIAVGYADPEGLVAYSQKKPLDVIRSYNEVICP